LGGYVSFTTYVREFWGPFPREDPLEDYFCSPFEFRQLVNIFLIKLSLTWRNLRIGVDVNSKRLDKFYVYESIIANNIILKSWVESGGISNHNPLLLCLDSKDENPPTPFMFIVSWLKDTGFIKIVEES